MRDSAVMLAAAGVGCLVARGMPFPAAIMTGPVLASAIVHLRGWIDPHKPCGLCPRRFCRNEPDRVEPEGGLGLCDVASCGADFGVGDVGQNRGALDFLT